MTLEIGVSFIEIYVDSKLIINQLSLKYDVKHEVEAIVHLCLTINGKIRQRDVGVCPYNRK